MKEPAGSQADAVYSLDGKKTSGGAPMVAEAFPGGAARKRDTLTEAERDLARQHGACQVVELRGGAFGGLQVLHQGRINPDKRVAPPRLPTLHALEQKHILAVFEPVQNRHGCLHVGKHFAAHRHHRAVARQVAVSLSVGKNHAASIRVTCPKIKKS